MSDSVIYLFVDTNLLLQCRPLEELDWSAWSAFGEVRLIVSNPVLREIDYRKNKGNDRVGSRARATSAMFRAMIGDEHKLIREGDPRVTLSVEPQHQYSSALKDRLSYQERDDQLIGIVYGFAHENLGVTVRLLTHDTTPLYTARTLGLAADAIPDDWLLPPENTDSEREVTALRFENARLKRAEPFFAIRCIDENGADVDRYEVTYAHFDPLTDTEVDDLMRQLRDHYPPETDFGPHQPAEREMKMPGFRIPGIKEEFVPTTDDEIAKYCEESYPQWLESSRATLQEYHQTLQRAEPVPMLIFLTENCGTRPAVDALITIEAKGNFQIRPSVHADDESNKRDDSDENDESNQSDDTAGCNETKKTEQASGLSRPPAPPRGRWRMTKSENDLGAFERLTRSLYGIHSSNVFEKLALDVPLFQPTPHDPNAFYYKHGRPSVPEDAFSLTCDQWRHEDGEMTFSAEIYFSANQEQVKGALVCRIQASNLSQSASKLIPIRVDISRISAFSQARNAVAALTKK